MLTHSTTTEARQEKLHIKTDIVVAIKNISSRATHHTLLNNVSTQPIHLPQTSQHSAILDSLYRLVNAYDRNDIALHDSAWLTSSPTTTFILNGTTLTGIDQIRKSFELIGSMNTTHMVTNPRIFHDDEEGSEKGRVTATVLAQHYRAGEGLKDGATFFLAGCFYDLDVVFDSTDGLWKAEKFVIELVWSQGDSSIVQPGRDLLEKEQ